MTSSNFISRRIVLPALGSLALCLLALPACKRPDSAAAPTPNAPPAAAASVPAAAPASAVAANLAKVKGRWLRPDGEYLLVIGAIADDGRAEAEYFNPNPIRVAWAMVKAEDTAIKVNVELRDQNYPGCLYKLTYVPEKDQLLGTYFQAQMQQTYDVMFVRAP